MTRACGAILTDVQGQNLRGKFIASTPLVSGLNKQIKKSVIETEKIEENLEVNRKGKFKSVQPVVKKAKMSHKNNLVEQASKGCNCNNADKSSNSQTVYNVNINKPNSKNKNKRKPSKKSPKSQGCKCNKSIYNKLCDISNQIQDFSKTESTLKNTVNDDELISHLSTFFKSLRVTSNSENKSIILNDCGELVTACKCHPIAKFINFTINYIIDWKNYIWNCSLFTFLLRTLQQFIFMIFGIKFQITRTLKRMLLPF